MPRSIAAERIELAEELWLLSRPTREITRELATRFGVSSRQARHYLALARARVAKRFADAPDPDAYRAQAEAALQRVLARAEAEGDASGAVLAATRLLEIRGLFAREFRGTVTVNNIGDLMKFVGEEAMLDEQAGREADPAKVGA